MSATLIQQTKTSLASHPSPQISPCQLTWVPDLLQLSRNRMFTFWNCCSRGWLLWNLTSFLINSIVIWFRLHSIRKESSQYFFQSWGIFWVLLLRNWSFLVQWGWVLEKGMGEGSRPSAVSGGNGRLANLLLRGIYSSERFEQTRLVPANPIIGHCFPVETNFKKKIRNQFSWEIVIVVCIP